MDVAALIPVPDPIPVHWFWFQGLLTVTFFLHIVVMDVMLGLGIIALVNHIRNRGNTELCRDISKKLPYFIAFTVNFGVAPLLFVQVLYGHFIYSSSILMATFWLSIVGLLILAYYLAYIYSYNFERLGTIRVAVVGVMVFFLVMIGFFFTNNMTLLQDPASWSRYFASRSGLLLHLGDPAIWPRYLHFVLSAVAVGGLAIALLGEYRRRQGQADTEDSIRTGTAWFGYATMANFGAGFWFLGVLPQSSRDPATFTGKFFLIFLALGILAALWSAIMALRGRVLPALYGLLAAVFCMILARDFNRAGYLRDYFAPGKLEVAAQYSPLFLFLLLFVAGLALIAWMVWLAMTSSKPGEARS